MVVPAGRAAAVLNVATPSVSDVVPRVVAPSVKDTVPVGVPAVDVTVAVRSTD